MRSTREKRRITEKRREKGGRGLGSKWYWVGAVKIGEPGAAKDVAVTAKKKMMVRTTAMDAVDEHPSFPIPLVISYQGNDGTYRKGPVS